MNDPQTDNDPRGATQALQRNERDRADETANRVRESFAAASRLASRTFDL